MDSRGSDIKIKLNGEDFTASAGINIEELLQELDIQAGRVAVEVNLKIVKKTGYGNHTLKDGDSVEIVNYVGGG